MYPSGNPAWISWLRVATRCSSAPLACGSPSFEHSPGLCAWCPHCRQLGSAWHPVNTPPWAQWRLLHSAGHTWLDDQGCDWGNVGEGGIFGPIATISDQQFACKHLGKAACRRHDCERPTEHSFVLSLSTNLLLEMTVIKYLCSLPRTPANPQLQWQRSVLFSSADTWLWQKNGQGGKHVNITYPLWCDRGHARAVRSA